MMTPITIESIKVQGFRAYLKPQSFFLRDGKRMKSLALFASNAKGKSSLVDAVEYYFSEDATLQRLGQRASQSQAGPAALEHIEARAYGVDSQVVLKFRQGVETFGDTRSISDGKDIPSAAGRVLSATRVPFVIHGYELRGFVEATAEQRYQEIAAWFSLEPFLDLQRRMRTLQRRVKEKADSDTEVTERIRDLRGVTSNAVSNWDEAEVCDWFNTNVLSKLDSSLVLKEISEADDVFSILSQRRAEEEKQLGLAALKTLIGQIDALTEGVLDGAVKTPGLIADFEASNSNYEVAVKNEAYERKQASQSVFHDIWIEAEKVFDHEEHEFSSCPLCDTEFGSTPHSTREGVRSSVKSKLAVITSYRQALSTLSTAEEQLASSRQALTTALEGLQTGLVGAGQEPESGQVLAYLGDLKVWQRNLSLPDGEALAKELLPVRRSLSDAKRRLESEQGESTYANAHNVATKLVQLRNDLSRIYRTKEALEKLHGQLVTKARVIEATINAYQENLLSQLGNDVDKLYKKIQGVSSDESSLLRLQLAEGSVANQRQIRLEVDYAENRKAVAPSGYLSDSQIHTVALSLRLAAIRRFNFGAPIVVLDDIVTSYDSDHRKSMAATLAEEFRDFQVLLVTHDEQFFHLLQDHLPQSQWKFRRITHIDPSFGPILSDHRTPDEEIERRLDEGESAGEEIRKSQEEWLLRICREFRVDIEIRQVDQPYKYNRSELATALHKFLNGRNLVPPKVVGISDPFLISLQRGTVENLASHSSDNPNRSTSGGDEKTRWEEFLYFRDQFVCPSCGGDRFKRPQGFSRPICKRPQCETQFSF